MNYSRSIIQIIQERCSRRSYTLQPVEAEKLGALSDFFAAVEGPFGGKARFLILDTTGWGDQEVFSQTTGAMHCAFALNSPVASGRLHARPEANI